MKNRAFNSNPIRPFEDNLYNKIERLSEVFVSTPDLKSLAQAILEITLQAVGGERGSLFYFFEEKGEYRLIESHPRTVLPDPLPLRYQEDPLVQALRHNGKILVREEMERWGKTLKKKDGAEWKVPHDVEMIIPLHSNGKLIGMMDVGSKISRQSYVAVEKEWLCTVANLAAVTIENRKLADDLRKSKSHIQRADRLASLGTLTAALAHELRNPLVAIKTFTQLLPERLDDEEFRSHFLHIVSGEVDRITTLVNELLEFARPTDPKMDTEYINSILDSIILLVSTGTKKKHIHITKDLSHHLPPIWVDREQIKQVFLNLLINAIEATPENGTVHVQTRQYTKATGEAFVQIEFADTGCGIPSEHLESIFNPFFTTKHKGSGLGLSISNQIVQDHKGTIDVESRVNKGTTFYVNLPLHPEGFPKRKPPENV